MTICMIAAVGKNLELGKDNNLIWHFKDDMALKKPQRAVQLSWAEKHLNLCRKSFHGART